MAAEFVACYKASNHGIWLRNFVTRLRILEGIERPLKLYNDNKSAVLCSNNNRSLTKSKHIDIKFLVVKERVQSEQISVEHIGTNSMIADPLKKDLPPKVFHEHAAHMGVVYLRTFWTLVPYPLISDSDIFGDNLGLAEITSALRPGHVAPRLTRRRHLATCSCRDLIFWNLGSAHCALLFSDSGAEILSSGILDLLTQVELFYTCMLSPWERLCPLSSHPFWKGLRSSAGIILPYLEVSFVVVSASICCLWCVTFLAGVFHSVTLVTSFCDAIVPFNVEIDRSPTPTGEHWQNRWHLTDLQQKYENPAVVSTTRGHSDDQVRLLSISKLSSLFILGLLSLIHLSRIPISSEITSALPRSPRRYDQDTWHLG
ncbi:hypothetical protein HYC85_030814 [Camellia sinensis]|uniref:Uncharacterized protein n=1 Tax=Camellia sinensis TaxID=4442 RepID=A0A7J7G1Q5_CAMSI|nr:hypothetical protein HYC85_030814 [Camellia sinensis]